MTRSKLFFGRPGNLHLRARKTYISGKGTAGQSMKEEKSRK